MMGCVGKIKEKEKARELRRKGLSYSEILKQVNVSKDSISHWCRDIELNEKQIRRLYLNKKTGNLKGSIVAARNKQIRRKRETTILLKQGIKEVGNLSRRDFFIAGVMLYSGDGSKTDGCVTFSNTSPVLIDFMMRWFREFCEVPNDKLRALLYLHENLNKKKAKEYWSRLTGIPLSQFHKTYIAKNNPDRLHKNVHPYGVLKIGFSSTKIHRRLIGWIEGVTDGKIETIIP